MILPRPENLSCIWFGTDLNFVYFGVLEKNGHRRPALSEWTVDGRFFSLNAACWRRITRRSRTLEPEQVDQPEPPDRLFTLHLRRALLEAHELFLDGAAYGGDVGTPGDGRLDHGGEYEDNGEDRVRCRKDTLLFGAMLVW